ncbi:type VI secretion protein [Stenotrophomonas lactitubi]|uniref:TrbC/VirB2 family protein n=1 Tax=Stenotrophomonas TaxID=40323 RepID=UPI000C27A0F3|nr:MULTISPECIES: TrbC/VirB2 family protein [Stenotrophomonas]MBD3681612.1 TrbC/VirB2 family protein [Stenotrophomonas sp. Br8]PJO52665.1 type VI secretion protein [Stenotrophomonas lactitubi]
MKRINIDLVQAQRTLKTLLMATLFVGAVFAPQVFAGGATDFGGTDKKVCGFFNNINGLLNIASIAVVTIAVIFAGYQIAFAHKRIADVAPILIGGVLIGAAGQIARMLLGDGSDGKCGGGGTTGGGMALHIQNAILYYSA